MNRVVVELASMKAIAGDELGRGVSSGAPVRTTMGGGGPELTQPHQLWKAATARRAGSQETAQQWQTTACMPCPSAMLCSEGGQWWKSEMRE